MSSTNRGAERRKDDYYVTPDWMVEEFLDIFLQDYPLREEAIILDCCAGGCANYDMPYPKALIKRGFTVITQDIREDSRAAIKADYLAAPAALPYDLIITNPSFTLSVDITIKAINEAAMVVMLQRSGWIGSNWRKPFWRDAPLCHNYAHNKRPSFTCDGHKDSIEYSHYVFKKGHTGKAFFDIIL